MIDVISVRFREGGKVYYFDPGEHRFATGDPVVVETSKGLELGRCSQGNHAVDDHAVIQPLKPIVRPASADDLRVEEINKKREDEAFGICEEKIAKHDLKMKLVKVECSFEGNKIIFYFTADGRVDFRELVKDLAGVFRTRIELRQIGVRDEAKMLGGIGICGQPYCCTRFLNDFQPVSTKMAKTQSLSLNPVKISGCCGRLMCCLRYEQEAYEDLIGRVPKTGCYVETEEGYGNVVSVDLLRQNVKVRLDGSADATLRSFDAEDVAEVPGGRPPEGETPPHVLQKREKKPKLEEENDEWALPVLFSDTPAPEAPVQAEPEKPKQGNNHRRNRGNRGGEKKPQNKKPKPPVEKKAAEAAPKAQPKAAPKAAPKAEGEKKPNSNYRRRFHSRGKKRPSSEE